MNEPGSEGANRRGLWPWAMRLERHSTLFATGVIGLFALLRVSAVARGDIDTARAVVRYSSTSGIVLASLLESIPLVLAVVGALLIFPALKKPHPNRILLGLWAVPALLVTPLPILGGVVVFWAAMGWRWKDRSTDRVGLIVGSCAAGLLGATVIAPLSQDHVWLPAERLVNGDSGEVIVGYVLGGDGPDLVVLKHREREVVFLPQELVVRRTLCDVPTVWGGAFKTLPQLTSSRPYPPCSLRADLGGAPGVEAPQVEKHVNR